MIYFTIPVRLRISPDLDRNRACKEQSPLHSSVKGLGSPWKHTHTYTYTYSTYQALVICTVLGAVATSAEEKLCNCQCSGVRCTAVTYVSH